MRRPEGSRHGGVYREGPIAFTLPPAPSGWRAIDVKDASLAFRDDDNSASVLVNARCLSADDRTPLVALTNHLLIGATERKYLSQEVEPFDGREALHTKLEAKWDGVPMTIDVYVLSKDGCVYDFVYVGGQIYIDKKASPAIRAQAQGLFVLMSYGVGRLFGLNDVNRQAQ